MVVAVGVKKFLAHVKDVEDEDDQDDESALMRAGVRDSNPSETCDGQTIQYTDALKRWGQAGVKAMAARLLRERRAARARG